MTDDTITTATRVYRNAPPYHHVRAQQRVAATHARRATRLTAFLTDAVTVEPTPYPYDALPQDSYGYGLMHPADWSPAPWVADELADAALLD